MARAGTLPSPQLHNCEGCGAALILLNDNNASMATFAALSAFGMQQ